MGKHLVDMTREGGQTGTRVQIEGGYRKQVELGRKTKKVSNESDRGPETFIALHEIVGANGKKAWDGNEKGQKAL